MIGRKQPPKAPPKVEPKAFDDFEMRLGDIMRGERATLGKSLLDIQRDLKIKATYIAAIENADVSAFETPGFIAGYVRSYARYLGMDPEKAFDTFCAEANFTTVNGLERGKTQPSPAFKRGTTKKTSSDPRDSIFENKIVFAPKSESVFERVEPGAIGSSLVLLALVSAIGYGGWAVLREIQQVQVTPVDQAPGVVAQVDPLDGSATAFVSPDTAETVGVGTNNPDTFIRIYRPQVLNTPELEKRDGPIVSIDPGLSEVTRGAEQVTVALSEAPPSAPSLSTPKVLADAAPEVMLVAVRDSWVRVRAADGSVLLEKTLQAGDTFVLPQTEKPATLRAGAAGGVFFMVNGQTYGPAGSRGEVVDKIALEATTLTEQFAQVDTEKDADGRKAVQVAEAALIGGQNGVSE